MWTFYTASGDTWVYYIWAETSEAVWQSYGAFDGSVLTTWSQVREKTTGCIETSYAVDGVGGSFETCV